MINLIFKFLIQLDLALFKKGKKGGAKGSVKKAKKYMGNDPRSEQYGEMITPRQDQAQNLNSVEEDQEEDMAGQEESQQIMGGEGDDQIQ